MRNLCNLRSVLNITWQLKENLLHVAVKRKAKRVSCLHGYVQYLLFVSLPYSLPGFIGFSFVRMPIVGNPVMVRKDMGSVCPATMKCMALISPFMKATEGGDHADDTFPFNFDQAHRYGFIRGAYHFFSPKTDPLKQADFFIRTVQLIPGDLPPVLDVETIGKSTPHDLRIAVKTWLDRIESHYGVKPILYTSYKFKNRYLSDSVFNTYPYWIAHYYVDSVKYEGPWHFWQHTDVGNVPGIREEVDLNVFNGSLEQLRALTLQK